MAELFAQEIAEEERGLEHTETSSKAEPAGRGELATRVVVRPERKGAARDNDDATRTNASTQPREPKQEAEVNQGTLVTGNPFEGLPMGRDGSAAATPASGG